MTWPDAGTTSGNIVHGLVLVPFCHDVHAVKSWDRQKKGQADNLSWGQLGTHIFWLGYFGIPRQIVVETHRDSSSSLGRM